MNPKAGDVPSNGPPLPGTAEELLTLVYEELRAMAARRLSREAPGQTLQATALVHEAWIKLGDGRFENRAHFFAAAAEAMRRILVDNARRTWAYARAWLFEDLNRNSGSADSLRNFPKEIWPKVRPHSAGCS